MITIKIIYTLKFNYEKINLGMSKYESPYHYVTPRLPEEAEIWEQVVVKLKEKGLFEEVDKISEGLKLRFVRGSEFVKKRDKMVKRIVQYLEESMEYRRKYKVDTILLSHKPYMRELRDSLWPAKFYQRTEHFNFDNLEKLEKQLAETKNKDYSYKPHRCVLFMDLADADFKKAKVFNTDTLTAHVAYSMELLTLKLTRSWLCTSRLILIYDLSKLTMSHYYAWYKAGAAKLLKVLGTNYPESVDKIYVLNPPRIFSWCFQMVKPLMEPDTVLKIKLLRGDKEIEKAFTKEGIDLKKMPKSHFKDGTIDSPYEDIIDDTIIDFAAMESEDKSIEDVYRVIEETRKFISQPNTSTDGEEEINEQLE